jgi:hypothetical protein
MKMNTRLLYRVKNNIRKFFGLRELYHYPNKKWVMRTDLINHKVVDEEIVKKLFNVSDIRDSIVDGKFPKTVKEEFNELPFSRLSEDAMREIIQIVKSDIENQISKLEEYTSSFKNALDRVSEELDKGIK